MPRLRITFLFTRPRYRRGRYTAALRTGPSTEPACLAGLARVVAEAPVPVFWGLKWVSEADESGGKEY